MDKFVLYGAGELGRWTARTMHKAGKPPFAFSDSNPRLWGKVIHNTLCMPLAQVPRTATVVATVYNGGEIRRWLRNFGYHVVSFAEFFRKHCHELPDIPVPYSVYDCRDLIERNRLEIDYASRLWEDDESIAEFNGQILYRQTLNDAVLPRPRPIYEQYFPPEQPFRQHECFVDGGAFTGDTAAEFYARRPAGVDKLICIEPDRTNAEKCIARLSGQYKGNDWQVQTCALSNRPGYVLFKSTGTAGSCISSESGVRVPTDTLDRLLIDQVPTRIKLDIEGAEPMALAGAKRTLQRCKPDLAVCLYHCPEHLWTIPRYLKSVVPDYKLYLRRYAEECWELVCYATVRK